MSIYRKQCKKVKFSVQAVKFHLQIDAICRVTTLFHCTRFLISLSVVKCSEQQISVALISYANICTKTRQRKTYNRLSFSHVIGGAYSRHVTNLNRVMQIVVRKKITPEKFLKGYK